MMIALLPLALLVSAQTESVPEQAEPPQPLTLEQKADLRCAAAFAIISRQQKLGSKAAAAYPPMEPRGREFFIATGQKLVDTGRSEDEVGKMFRDEALAFDQAVTESGDFNTTVDAIMTPCLMRLDAEVPKMPSNPLEKSDPLPE